MDIKQLNEELTNYIEDKIDKINWETLDDILRLGCEVSNDELPEYIETILAPENTGIETIITLWSDIDGTFDGNRAKIIELMREDLDNYIPEKIADWKQI